MGREFGLGSSSAGFGLAHMSAVRCKVGWEAGRFQMASFSSLTTGWLFTRGLSSPCGLLPCGRLAWACLHGVLGVTKAARGKPSAQVSLKPVCVSCVLMSPWLSKSQANPDGEIDITS